MGGGQRGQGRGPGPLQGGGPLTGCGEDPGNLAWGPWVPPPETVRDRLSKGPKKGLQEAGKRPGSACGVGS